MEWWEWAPGWLAVLVSIAAIRIGVRTRRVSDARAAKIEARAVLAEERAARIEKQDSERADRAEERLKALEQAEAVRLEILRTGEKCFEGYEILVLASNGTSDIDGVAIDPESVLSIGIGGATIFSPIEAGDIARHFWFRGPEKDWPDTIRVTFTTPFEGSRRLRVPKRPAVD